MFAGARALPAPSEGKEEPPAIDVGNYNASSLPRQGRKGGMAALGGAVGPGCVPLLCPGGRGGVS